MYRSLVEVMVPREGEEVVLEAEARPVSGVRHEGQGLLARLKGLAPRLVVSSHRVAVLGRRVASIPGVHVGEPLEVREAPLNVGYEWLLSAAIRYERRLGLLKTPILEVIYEAPEGPTRKALLRVPDAERVRDAITEAAGMYRRSREGREDLPVKLFMAFVEFLLLSKSVRPVYFDRVSRCVVIGDSYACIRGLEWEVEGSPDLRDKVSRWVREFRVEGRRA